eukprot:m.175118 g.175118  ORF g.175118 m.175118 type:complete len:193 (+) comp31799_c4_seq1:124-702(+)
MPGVPSSEHQSLVFPQSEFGFVGPRAHETVLAVVEVVALVVSPGILETSWVTFVVVVVVVEAAEDRVDDRIGREMMSCHSARLHLQYFRGKTELMQQCVMYYPSSLVLTKNLLGVGLGFVYAMDIPGHFAFLEVTLGLQKADEIREEKRERRRKGKEVPVIESIAKPKPFIFIVWVCFDLVMETSLQLSRSR